MYARSTTLQADPQRMDDGIADVRDNVMPNVLDMDGCIGLSMLCDRDSGRCIVTTSWQSEEAMAASRERVRALRDRAVDMFGGAPPQVDEWEIAVMHRAHAAGDGACARVVWSRLHDAGQADRTIDAWKAGILPRLDGVEGFCSVSLMVDRAGGRGVSTVTFDSRQAMEASREMGDRMRDEFSGRMAVDITDIAEMDLVIHHLRVPELA